MLKFIRLLPVILLLTLTTSSAVAQEVTDTGWPVQERCTGSPTAPPKGWTYNGTILLTGNSGIHGVNAAWETPHILTFLDDNDLWGGALSPDGQWYASPRGTFTITETYNGITEIDELRVSSVDGERNHFYKLPINNNPNPKFTFFQYTHAQVYWRDNQSFIYAKTQFNPFTGAISDWPTSDTPFDGQPDRRFYFAPDWTRWIFTSYDANTNNGFTWKMGDLSQNKILGTLNISSPIAWKPDSSEFVATLTDGAKIPSYSLDLFDHDGKQIETIFSVPSQQQVGMFTLGWSPDNRYFAFVTFNMYIEDGKAYTLENYFDPHNTLYIADTQNKIVFNTCQAIGDGLAWSPDANTDEITFLEPGEGLKDVLIMDMNTYKPYSVARHVVSYNRRIYNGSVPANYGIIGWRES